jgi:acyl-CoA thioester hydrolase
MSNDFLQKFPHPITLQVQWGEMDAAQHVNNTVYLRYFEIARIEYLHSLGLIGPSPEQPVGFVVAEVSCRYKVPLTYPDDIVVGAYILPETRTETSIELYQMVYSQKLQRIAAEGRARLVSYDYDLLRKAPLPPHWDEILRNI